MAVNSNVMPVSEAAAALGVHPSRVRAMVHAGQLDAHKVAGRWLIEVASVDRRSRSDVVDGRPFSSANAWALLLLAQGKPAHWVEGQALSRLRRHLRERDLQDLAPRLRSRAQVLRLRGHPSVLHHIASESGVAKAGVSAAREAGIDIEPSEELEAYVPDNRVDALIARYRLEPSERPNVVLRVVDNDYPYLQAKSVGPLVAAIDLLESPDARSRRAALEFLQRVRRPSHRTAHPSIRAGHDEA